MPITTPNSQPSILLPSGIRYWTLFDDGYHEENARDNNVTRMMIATAWDTKDYFKRDALGYTTVRAGATYYDRHAPLKCPFANDQYLSSLKKARLGAGNSFGNMTPHAPNPFKDNWWTITGGTIIYEAIFGCPDYDIPEENAWRAGGADETQRYIIPEETVNARERKHSSAGYELDLRDANGNGVAGSPVVMEVGFTPFHTVEKVYTQVEVPWDWRPRTAIANTLLRTNSDVIFGNPPGTLLFKGFGSKLKWHRQPDESRAVDLPFMLDYNPRGWNTVPRNDNSNQAVRVRGTDGNPVPLYQSAAFAPLFQPQPVVAIEYSTAPGRYTRPTIGALQTSVPVQFNAIVTGLPVPYTFAWTFGDGGTSTSQFPLHSFATPGSFTVSLTVTDASGNTNGSSVATYYIV